MQIDPYTVHPAEVEKLARLIDNVSAEYTFNDFVNAMVILIAICLREIADDRPGNPRAEELLDQCYLHIKAHLEGKTRTQN